MLRILTSRGGLRTLAPALLLPLLGACDDPFFHAPAPAPSPGIALSFSLVESGAAARGPEEAFAEADRIRVRLSSGERVVQDTVVGLGGARDTVRIRAELEDDVFTGTLDTELLLGADLLFRAETPVSLARGEVNPVEVSLEPVAGRVAIAQDPLELGAIRREFRLGAAALFATGDTIPGAPIAWSVLDGPLEVRDDTLVVASEIGQGRLVASYQEASDTAAVQVSDARVTGPVRVAPADVGTDPAAVATLAEALEFIRSGGTVLVGAGRHDAPDVVVSKPVTIEAEEGSDAPVLDGNGAPAVLRIDPVPEEGVVIRGLALEDAEQWGILVMGTGSGGPGPGPVLLEHLALSGPFVTAAIDVQEAGVTLNQVDATGAAVGIQARDASLQGAENRFFDIDAVFGLAGAGTSVTMQHNDFTGFDEAVLGDADPASVDLTCNWWGGGQGPGADPAMVSPWTAGPVARGGGGLCHLYDYEIVDLGTPPGDPESRAPIITDAFAVAVQGRDEPGSPVDAAVWQDGILTPLDDLGRTFTRPFAMNDAGQVVGWVTTSEGAPYSVLWEGGAAVWEGPEGSRALDINESGMVVGEASDGQGSIDAYVFQNGELTHLDPPSYDGAFARFVNDAGRVTGTVFNPSDYFSTARAFRWNGGTFVYLQPPSGYDYTEIRAVAGKQFLNESGQALAYGAQASGGGNHFLLWDGGEVTDLSAAAGAQFIGTEIGNSGQVVGYLSTPDGLKAVTWLNGTVREIFDVEEGVVSLATGINDAEQVVGSVEFSGDVGRPFLVAGGSYTLIGSLAGEGGQAEDINSCAWITGFSLMGGQFRATLWRPIGPVDHLPGCTPP